MKKTIVLLTLILLLLSCKSKFTRIGDENANYIPYYLKVYEADSLYIIKEYEKSYAILDKLFNEYEPINIEIFNEYLNYIKLKLILKKKVKVSEINSLIEVHGYEKLLLDNDTLISNYLKSKKISLDYLKLRNNYLKNKRFDIRDKILFMKEEDQKYRKNNSYYQNITKQDSIDLINQKIIMNLFENLGYPNRKIIGGFNIDYKNADINSILLHTKDSIREIYFIPKIQEFVKKGTALPLVYASIVDQLYLYNGKESIYGVYDENKDNCCDIEKIKKYNKERKKIGLYNFGYQKWSFKNKYN